MSKETREILSGRKSEQSSPRLVGESPPPTPRPSPTAPRTNGGIPTVQLNDEPLTPRLHSATSSPSMNGKIAGENRNP